METLEEHILFHALAWCTPRHFFLVRAINRENSVPVLVMTNISRSHSLSLAKISTPTDSWSPKTPLAPVFSLNTLDFVLTWTLLTISQDK